MSARYTPGSWLGFAGPDLWLLVDVSADWPMLAQCWDLVRSSADPEQVVDQVILSGYRSVLNLVVAGRTPSGTKVIVRGDGCLTALTEDGEAVSVRALTGGWVDRIIEAPVVELRLSGQSASAGSMRLPLSDGVVLAADLVVGTDEAAGLTPVAEPLPVAEPVPAPEPVRVTEQVRAAEETLPPLSDVHPPLEGAQSPQEIRPPQQEVVPSGEQRFHFDALFGDTKLPTAEEEEFPEVAPRPVRAIRPSRDEPAPTPSHAADPDIMSDWSWAILPGDSGFDDSRPSGRQSGRAATGVPTANSDDVEALALTTHRPDRSAAADPSGSTVSAVFCDNGHANPPAAPRCRVCPAGVPPRQVATVVARPVLGLLRLSIGEVIHLDRGVVLGRAPGTPDPGLPERPHHVKLPSPQGDISRRHVEVRLDGWTVYVVDLASHNGTVLTLPGEPPRPLHPEDPVALMPGSRVELSADVWFTYEAAA